jgi:predicted  nucleic acid-binding Zn-ribbon protein
LRKKADQLEAALPEQARREFQRIFKQRGGVAVSKVFNDSCTTCRTRVRPRSRSSLSAASGHCEGCHRILYLEKTHPEITALRRRSLRGNPGQRVTASS